MIAIHTTPKTMIYRPIDVIIDINQQETIKSKLFLKKTKTFKIYKNGINLIIVYYEYRINKMPKQSVDVQKQTQ